MKQYQVASNLSEETQKAIACLHEAGMELTEADLFVDVAPRGHDRLNLNVTDDRGHLWLSTTVCASNTAWAVKELQRTLQIYRNCCAQREAKAAAGAF